ncbi:MAG: LPXTG cell wall anchor domain-containing protein [Flavobacteriales bacterium]|nr:LPXTG cell wall anchor domain-containing protein [Flavobacteriales bacterium]
MLPRTGSKKKIAAPWLGFLIMAMLFLIVFLFLSRVNKK